MIVGVNMYVVLLVEVFFKTFTDNAICHSKTQEQALMYGHGFQDLDGHNWDFVYMTRDAAAA